MSSYLLYCVAVRGELDNLEPINRFGRRNSSRAGTADKIPPVRRPFVPLARAYCSENSLQRHNHSARPRARCNKETTSVGRSTTPWIWFAPPVDLAPPSACYYPRLCHANCHLPDIFGNRSNAFLGESGSDELGLGRRWSCRCGRGYLDA